MRASLSGGQRRETGSSYITIINGISQMTNGAFQVSFGSLFPSLHRMEQSGWVAAEWRASENNRRAKYYKLTAAGRRRAAIEERDWNRVVEAITAALRHCRISTEEG
jgi:DNA-binding PadR family transcriptional regulator